MHVLEIAFLMMREQVCLISYTYNVHISYSALHCMLTMCILDTPHYTVENVLGLMKCYVYLIFVQSASALARTGKGRSAEEKKKDEE